MSFLQGLSAFPITPTSQDGRVDIESLRKLIARMAAAKVDSIGVLGSTGSYMYLTREERRRAIEATVDEVSGQIPIIAGIGALRTDEVIELAADAKAAGAHAGLLAPISYIPLTEDEVFDHYSTVAKAAGLPIIIYNTPASTNFHFTPELLARLSRVDGIIGMKNGAPEAPHIAQTVRDHRNLVSSGFSLGFSKDSTAPEALIAGGDVWYSTIGGLLPKISAKLTKAAKDGDGGEARRLNALIAPLTALMDEFGFYRVAYGIANVLRLTRSEPPLPVKPLPPAALAKLEEAIAALPAEALN